MNTHLPTPTVPAKDPRAARPWQGRRRILVAGVSLLALLVLGAVGYYGLLRFLAYRELDEVTAGLDRDDPGWRQADLEKQRTNVPAEENSGPLILKLRGQVPKNWWQEVEGETWRNTFPGRPLPDAQVALLRARIDTIEPLLPELRGLSDRPRGSFPINWTKDSISTLLPHMDAIRPMADVLLADVYWQVQAGDLDGALVSCRAIVNVARSVEEEPTLISQLVHTACLNLATQGTHHALAAGEPSPPRLTALQTALTEADRRDPFVVGMRGERAGMHELFTNLGNGTVPLPQVMALMGARGGSGFAALDRVGEMVVAASQPQSHIWLMKHFTAVIDAARLPPPEQTARLNALQAEPRNAPMLAKMITPAWVRCHDVIRRAQARRRCTIAGLAVERYRHEHGEWPPTLAALVPAFLPQVPADPCAAAPLQYRRTKDGVVIFSVGPAGTLRGDYFDQPRADNGVNSATAPNFEVFFEFRLWDVDKRGQ